MHAERGVMHADRNFLNSVSTTPQNEGPCVLHGGTLCMRNRAFRTASQGHRYIQDLGSDGSGSLASTSQGRSLGEHLPMGLELVRIDARLALCRITGRSACRTQLCEQRSGLHGNAAERGTLRSACRTARYARRAGRSAWRSRAIDTFRTVGLRWIWPPGFDFSGKTPGRKLAHMRSACRTARYARRAGYIQDCCT